VLPYEVPLTFSNRHFFNFVYDNSINLERTLNEKNRNREVIRLYWKKCDKALDVIVSIIAVESYNPEKIKDDGNENYIELENITTIPFSYRITHKNGDYRELSICHPLNQLSIVNFYHTYKEIILYYCNLSKFSLRMPDKIARYVYFRDNLHYCLASDDVSSKTEEFDKEYESIKTFFVYKKCENIYKFYDSNVYHEAEEKFSKLLKLDISKCFDSIYTHSIAWAVLGKDIVKEHIKKSKETFAGKFDKIIQELNYCETNGIIIGPEFSRIFAEVILQSVDVELLRNLSLNKFKLKYELDYEIFRYVDDYFIFYNDDTVGEDIANNLKICLKKYKLSLNTAKTEKYQRPIITPISIAKHKILSLLDDFLIYTITDNVAGTKKGKIFINSKRFKIQYKTIIFEENVEYKVTSAYTLFIIERKVKEIIKSYKQPDTEHITEYKFVQALIEIMDIVFFIYVTSPRVSNSIKLIQILKLIIVFTKKQKTNKKSMDYDNKHSIYKYIYDKISAVLKRNELNRYSQVETLYLLTILPELGKEYWLEEKTLCKYFHIEENENENKNYCCKEDLNYLSITVILFYMRNKKKVFKT
jgi:hypothetical protein